MAKEKSTKVVKTKKEVKKATPAHPSGRYVETVGRRKTAVAVVRLFMAGSEKGLHMTVNGRDFVRYFPLKKLQEVAVAPFGAVAVEHAQVTVKAAGGGIHAQAEAVRLGIARALIIVDPNHRSRLKALGYVKRDPRMVERKKPGLRKARRPQQWRKR